jgi:hypothetical protein
MHGTENLKLCSIFIGVPKRRHRKSRSRGITQNKKNTTNVAWLKVRIIWCIYLPLQHEGFSSSQRLHSIKTTHELKPHVDANAPCKRVFLKHNNLHGLLPTLTAVFGSARYCSVCWAKRVQFTHSIYVYLRFILILSYCLFLDGPNNIFCSDLPTDSLYTFCPHSHTPLLFCPPRSPSSFHPNNVCWRAQVLTLPIIFSLHLSLPVQLLSSALTSCSSIPLSEGSYLLWSDFIPYHSHYPKTVVSQDIVVKHLGRKTLPSV